MMKRALILLCLSCAVLAAAEPVRVVFDTDMGNDVDDALALALLHSLESRGEAKILAVTITKDNAWAPVFVDLLDTFYGRPGIPIGIVKGGKTTDAGNYNRLVAEKTRPGGGPAYARKLTPESPVADATAMLRRTLAAQPDASVVIVQVGFSTNLARLLDSGPDDASPLPGTALAKQKVRLLVTMAGNFLMNMPEYNVMIDVPAAKRVFKDWPTPLVTSGFEIGLTTLYPVERLETDFRYGKDHPVLDAYRAYQKMPYREPLWDPTAALYAVRPDAGYFSLSAPGEILVDDQGRTSFRAGPGSRQYLTVDDLKRARIIEAISLLVSDPPERCR